MPKGKSAFDRDCVCPARIGKAKSKPRSIKGLVNARLLAFEFDSFEVPSDSEIRKLKPGDFVKIARKGDRFWVRIDGYVGRKWHGTVANDLVDENNDDLRKGESIFFSRKHIYDLRRK